MAEASEAGPASAKSTAKVDALRGQIRLGYVIATVLAAPVAILAFAAWNVSGWGIGPAIMFGMIAFLYLLVTLVGAWALRRAKRA
ncbi:MAG: hypothetical protein AAGH15_10720 [Myxococcota bacterium]